jgi:hypothetical protein
MEKMGFEKVKRRPQRSYGHRGTINIDGIAYRCASGAEAKWLQAVAPGLKTGNIAALQWQPQGFAIKYNYDRHECKDVYRPDAIITWPNGEEWVIEIKNGRIEQVSGSKMKRFAQQYPDRKLVLVWFGRVPKKGPTARRLARLEPWLHHTWRM